MPKKLILSTLFLLSLTGCALQPDSGTAASSPCPDISPYTELQAWFALERESANMETSQVVAELVKLGRPESPKELFYFGLLNQQLGTASNWRQARNAFRDVRKDAALPLEQRRLASILERYNIYRLSHNKDRRDLLKKQEELEENLATKEEESNELQEKIQAITELETDMSTRIEQEQ